MAPTDTQTDLVRALAEILNDTGLTEIEFEGKDVKVRVAKQGAPVAVAPIPVAAAPAAGVAAAATPEVDDFANHPGALTSPMVGVAYLSPDPEAPDFVKEGDRVAEGQTLLLIEAMKVFNPIHAPKAGTVSRILVESGSPVEFAEPLVIIE